MAAYEVVHRREGSQGHTFSAKRAARQAARVVASGGQRVRENTGRSASVSRPDPGKLTSQADIRSGSWRGEISFDGSFHGWSIWMKKGECL